jgi:GTPase SAR1 family protein
MNGFTILIGDNNKGKTTTLWELGEFLFNQGNKLAFIGGFSEKEYDIRFQRIFDVCYFNTSDIRVFRAIKQRRYNYVIIDDIHMINPDYINALDKNKIICSCLIELETDYLHSKNSKQINNVFNINKEDSYKNIIRDYKINLIINE